MGYARCHLIDPSAAGAYHVVSRCVRRAWLCGEDKLTGQSFDHRRGLIEQRIHHLAECFALSVWSYALMSNHLHRVVWLQPNAVDRWSDDEVVARWRKVCPVKARKGQDTEKVSPERIAEWRERLGSLSWFMRALLEHIARVANQEDHCTGRFWEGRFRSQALLDEHAILAAMAYVDLNPVRAGIASTVSECTYTSVARRIAQCSESVVVADPKESPGAERSPVEAPRGANAVQPATSDLLQPVAGLRDALRLAVRTSDYLDLVAWSGSVPKVGKASLPTAPDRVLRHLGCSLLEWQEQMTAMRTAGRAVGGTERMRELADQAMRGATRTADAADWVGWNSACRVGLDFQTPDSNRFGVDHVMHAR